MKKFYKKSKDCIKYKPSSKIRQRLFVTMKFNINKKSYIIYYMLILCYLKKL